MSLALLLMAQLDMPSRPTHVLMRAKRTRHGRRCWLVHDPSEKSVSRNFVFYAAELTRT
jgi:hypothetical protein